MAKKRRMGLQIRFNPESEQDIIEFLSTLKKTEVHVTAVFAFRMYMRAVGFYENRWLENSYPPNMLRQKELCNTGSTEKKAGDEKNGLVDKEAFETLDSMFDNENELTD